MDLQERLDSLNNNPDIKNAFFNVQRLCHAVAVRKGWWQEGKQKSFPEQLMLQVSELSEALEEYRNGHAYLEIYEKDGKPEGISIELADCVIRIFDTCDFYGIDLYDAIMKKMEYNITRPYRHGNKLV